MKRATSVTGAVRAVVAKEVNWIYTDLKVFRFTDWLKTR